MTPQQLAAMKMALDLATMHHTDDGYAALRAKVRSAIKEALAQPEQEPFGYFRYDLRLDAWVQNRAGITGTPFYTTPPQRTWVGLTDEEIEAIWYAFHDREMGYAMRFTRAIEAKLKEKNT